MGFGADVSGTKTVSLSAILKHVEPDDLLGFGLIPELIGRLPVLTTLDELDEDALFQILTEPKNALVKQYHRLFEMDNIHLEFKEAALKAVVRLAMKKKTGARALRSIMEDVMLDIMFELPSMENVSECTITENVILGKKGPVYNFQREEKKRARA